MDIVLEVYLGVAGGLIVTLSALTAWSYRHENVELTKTVRDLYCQLDTERFLREFKEEDEANWWK